MTSTIENAKSMQAELVSMRRHLHAHPELNFVEYKTSQYAAEKLTALGFSVRQIGGPTGLVADFGSGKTIAIRCDMDGLPISELNRTTFASQTTGVMHACGHDAHLACTLGAAAILSQSKLPGRIRIIIQPGDDADGKVGASTMLEAGALEGVTALLGLHVDATVPTGKVGIVTGAIMPTVQRFVISINGNDKDVYKRQDGDSESGSDQSAAEAKEAKPTAPDRLEIIVPLAYQGSLIVNNPGGGDIEVDNWCGGNAEVDNYPGGSFDLRLSGSGDFKIGAMKGLGATELRSSGDGDIDIASLQSRDFSARLSGSGDLEIDKIAVNDFTLRQSGSGTATICSGIALSGSVSNSGSGDTSMRGRFAAITKRNSGCGDIKIRVSE